MINKPPPSKGLNIRIPIRIPIKGRGLIHHGSTLKSQALGIQIAQSRLEPQGAQNMMQSVSYAAPGCQGKALQLSYALCLVSNKVIDRILPRQT